MLSAADFAGGWRITRDITDRYSGQDGRFVGEAVLSAVTDNTLNYEETGRLQLAQGPIMTATRRYQWRFDADGVDMRFEDGSAFHRFVPTGRGQGTDHPCGDDFYRVIYDFTAWPAWSSTWIVTGPRKDYTSVSAYNRG